MDRVAYGYIGIGFLGLIFYSLTVLLLVQPKLQSSSQQEYLMPPPENIEHFTFGFSESVADSFWLRWIQDSDVCFCYADRLTREIGVQPAQEDGDKLIANPRHKNCDRSWSYLMLRTVVSLSPRFLMPYLAGASTLAVLVEDYFGATEIYERGLMIFPQDWQLAYRASYHYLYDLRDLARAAQLLEAAAENGGPLWLRSLASRLYSRLGQLELGISTLEAYRKTVEDNPVALKQVDERLRDLRQQLAEQK